LTKAGRRWPASGSRSNEYTSRSPKNTFPTCHETPLLAIASPHPSRSQISSERFAKQIAREPLDSLSSSSSSSTCVP
jgi:hypothetical protein